MKNVLNKTYKGFTIIEVMIVLAIAGLIMVIVFFAIPQLQINQRDNARQNAINRTKAELETYASNNQGVYPFRTAGQTLADFQARYLNNVQIKNPKSGGDYVPAFAGGAGPPNNPEDTLNEIFLYPGMTCQGENATGGTYTAPSPTQNTKQYAVRVELDRNNTFYCVDNG